VRRRVSRRLSHTSVVLFRCCVISPPPQLFALLSSLASPTMRSRRCSDPAPRTHPRSESKTVRRPLIGENQRLQLHPDVKLNAQPEREPSTVSKLSHKQKPREGVRVSGVLDTAQRHALIQLVTGL
jgi:hypothetical protein